MISGLGDQTLAKYSSEGDPSLTTYADRSLTCVECGQSFIFSADDQTYHAEKGYTNEPKRCPSCREGRRQQRYSEGGGGGGGYGGGGGGGGGGYDAGAREMHPVVCADCGKDTTVPFRPRSDRPVYCRDCFTKRGGGAPTTRRF